MKVDANVKRKAMAIAAYRGKQFQGYAVKTHTGTWIAVGSLGISWAKWNCTAMLDAQTWLRTTSYAARFDLYSEAADIKGIIEKLPEYQQPSITIESLGNVIPMSTRLHSQTMVYFTPS